MISIIILLVVANIISLFIIIKLQKECSDYRTKSDKLKSEQYNLENTKKNLISIGPGDRAIIDFPLILAMGTKDEKEFKVTYEVEILEISLDQVKVKAIDFTSYDKVAQDVIHRQKIIDFMKDKWIPKKDIEVIIDDSKRRDMKIDEILKK